MNCQYLTGKYFKACSVSREAYVPSAFEMQEYCTSNRHTLCPFYRKRTSDHPQERRIPALAGSRR